MSTPPDLSDDSFQWDEVTITQEEYEVFLSKIQEIEEVVQVRDSLMMNEARVNLTSLSTTPLNTVLSEYPEVEISRVRKEGNGLEVDIRTTHWFMSEEELEEMQGECTLEGMVFLVHEFELFPNVTESSLQQDEETGELSIFVSAENVDSLDYFGEVISFASLYVKEVEWDSNSEVSVLFAWDGESAVNSVFIHRYNQSKYHSFARAVYRASPPITCGKCGSKCESELMMISNSTDKVVDSFERRQALPEEYPYNGDLIRVPLKPEEESSVMRELDTYPESTGEPESEDGFVSVSLPFGYYCTECEALLSPRSAEMKELLHSFVSTVTESVVSCDVDGETFSFKQYPVPYIDWDPVGEPHPLVQNEANAFKELIDE